MGFHEASGDTIALTVETGKYQKHIGKIYHTRPEMVPSGTVNYPKTLVFTL